MPKQIYQIKDFSGGLNNLQVPTDIRDNQLSNVQNLMFNTRGAMYPVYKMTDSTNNRITGDYENTHINTIEPGYGLGYFETDHQAVAGTTFTQAKEVTSGPNKGWGFKTDGDDHFLFCITAGGTTGSPTFKDFSSDFSVGEEISLTGLAADGAEGSKPTKDDEGIYTITAIITQSSATLGSTTYSNFNTLRLNRPIVSAGSYQTFFSATIKGYPFGDQIILLSHPEEHKIDVFSTKNNTAWAEDVITLCSYEQGFDSKVKYLTHEDTIRCCDTTENTQSRVKWYGYISRTHFANTLDPNVIQGFYAKDNDLASPTDGALLADVTLTYANAGAGFDLRCFSSTTDGAVPSATYEFAQTFVYDGNQESLPTAYSGTLVATDLKVLSVQVGARGDYNERITGGRIYIRESGSDNEWILLLDMHLSKGVRITLSGDYTSWKYAGSNEQFYTGSAATSNISVPELNLINYEVINGFPSSVFSIDIGGSSENWQDSVIANNRAFVCNVRIADESKGQTQSTATQTIFRDRIMYSMPSRFDTFPYYNFIEAAKGDMDNYVAIDSYADRLLAFKRFSLDIININGDDRNWFLENSLKYQGILHSEAVKKTQYGIVWANKQGFFLYDGSQIRNLSENLISDSVWSAHIGDYSFIVYDEQESMAFVVKSSNDNGNAYMCDMKTGVWTFVNDFLLSSNDGLTNSVDTETNNTYIAYDSGSSVHLYKMDRAGVSSTNSRFQTKEIDFGNASVSKKVYAVYVTYKSDGALTGYFTLEEDDGTSHALSGDVATSASEWATVKLTPSSPVVCNKVAVKMNTSGNARKVHINDIGIDARVLKKRAA